ncbi:Gfo/Idh/MocA family protein [Lignipirellula cremea]|uniref:Inositol 2-dehydrogenase n=1 Tax=Lignipirellula cremea TaxID=2528010 RepID=A0A518DND5_9BACT|nr:Gfo/Idh/MocA family oxidoreductase [Lignipirellula cremea]QDU93341.1 Inositol 2-dehydrogenase [Lignipirellula cremea]
MSDRGSPASLTRRDWLAGTTLAAVGFWSFPTPARAATPMTRLNLGQIGVGNRGFNNLAELVGEQTTALCDVDAKFLARSAEVHPDARKYRDFRELLAQPGLDAVAISTPDHTHAPAAVAALRQGLHVYCEKPLAHTIASTRRLARLAKEQGVVTQMGNQHHASEGYRQAVAWLRSGVIGPVAEVHAWTSRPLWPQGVPRPPAKPVPPTLDWDLWLGPAPPRPYADGYHPYDWRGFWDFGSGALGDMGPHLLDPVVSGLRLQLPTHISAESTPVTAESPPRSSTVRYQFPAAADRGPVSLTWYDGGRYPGQEITTVKRPPDSGVMLLGERARLFIPVLGGTPRIVPHPGKEKGVPPEVPLEPINHQQQWADACRGQTQAASSFAYGALLTEISLLGNLALRVGQPINWDAAAMRARDCPAAAQYIGAADETSK